MTMQAILAIVCCCIVFIVFAIIGAIVGVFIRVISPQTKRRYAAEMHEYNCRAKETDSTQPSDVRTYHKGPSL